MNRRLHPFALATFSLVLLASASVPAQDNSVAANQELRIQQLEGQIRTLNGQLEQMNFRVQQMTDRIDKLVADVDFRLRQMEGGSAPAPPGEQGSTNPPSQSENENNAPEQPAMTENNNGAGSWNQSGGGTVPPGNGQPRTLGSMSQSQYDAQQQQLNQNADAAAA